MVWCGVVCVCDVVWCGVVCVRPRARARLRAHAFMCAHCPSCSFGFCSGNIHTKCTSMISISKILTVIVQKERRKMKQIRLIDSFILFNACEIQFAFLS